MQRMQRTWLLTALLALLVAGCGLLRPAAPPAVTREVTDSGGIVVRLPQVPQRIVSLSIATDEILAALVPPERIAALTYLADDRGISNIADAAKAVKARSRANAESIIALSPDLVLIPDWQPPELAQTLRDAGLAVYVFQSGRTIDSIKDNIRELAAVTGEPAKGDAVVAQMDAVLASVTDRVTAVPAEQQKVVLQFSLLGGIGGRGSSFDDLCRYAGVKNAAALAGFDQSQVVSKEALLAVNPDILLMPAWDYAGASDLEQYRSQIQNDPALQSVKAVRTRQLIQVPDRYLSASSQYIVQGVKAVAEAAYPELFR
ncbi:MAG: ABC transporter substrate-binding protein [Sporomusaceae bacterium]|nr:ABC transporter substrate-binding protein [Sporomusaceae bacterium]